MARCSLSGIITLSCSAPSRHFYLVNLVICLNVITTFGKIIEFDRIPAIYSLFDCLRFGVLHRSDTCLVGVSSSFRQLLIGIYCFLIAGLFYLKILAICRCVDLIYLCGSFACELAVSSFVKAKYTLIDFGFIFFE